MATFVLNSIIEIGNFKPFKGVNEVTIKKSIKNFCDTATVKLPATAVLKQNGEVITNSVMTARQFKRGDAIMIKLGYDEKYWTEFDGFVKRVNKSTPCVLECEGYAFQLRNKSLAINMGATTVKKIIEKIIAGTDITISPQSQDGPISGMVIPHATAFKVLQEVAKNLAKAYGFYMIGKQLFFGLVYTHLSAANKSGKADVFYKVGYNLVRDDQMKEHVAGDDETEVEVIHKYPKTGKRERLKIGTPNSNSIRKRSVSTTAADRKAQAQELELKKNYDGVEGKLTGFLQPYCRHGEKLKLADPRYPERNGFYLIDETEVKYGTGGARREVTLSLQLPKPTV